MSQVSLTDASPSRTLHLDGAYVSPYQLDVGILEELRHALRHIQQIKAAPLRGITTLQERELHRQAVDLSITSVQHTLHLLDVLSEGLQGIRSLCVHKTEELQLARSSIDLPHEILSQIFEIVMSSTVPAATTEQAFGLSHISSYWRHVAQANQNLWQQIWLRDFAGSPDLLLEWIERAPRELHVYIGRHFTPNAGDMDFLPERPSRGGAFVSSSELRKLEFEQHWFYQLAPQIVSVKFESGAGLVLADFERRAHRHYQHLQTLCIPISGSGGPTRPKISALTELRDLELYGDDGIRRWASSTLRLSTLTLTRVEGAVDDWRELFRGVSSTLHTLTLRHSSMFSSLHTFPPVVMTSLKELILDSMIETHGVEELVNLLECPALGTLRLSQYQSDSQELAFDYGKFIITLASMSNLKLTGNMLFIQNLLEFLARAITPSSPDAHGHPSTSSSTSNLNHLNQLTIDTVCEESTHLRLGLSIAARDFISALSSQRRDDNHCLKYLRLPLSLLSYPVQDMWYRERVLQLGIGRGSDQWGAPVGEFIPLYSYPPFMKRLDSPEKQRKLPSFHL